MSKNITTENHSKSELLKIIFIGFLSFISVFGIYNTFSDINLINIIGKISDPTEKYANYFILFLTMLTMIVLQGINFKRKDLFDKISVLFGIIIVIATVIAVIFFFTNSIVYPAISLLIVGISTYLLEMVFDTIGTKGFFFFLLIMSLGIIGVYKAGFHSNTLLINLTETVFALIIFIGATYPRIKSTFFKIGVRDNVDISNTGDDNSSDN